MAPIVKTSSLSPLIPVPWAGVRAWLDEAEATQAATGGSTAHLTAAQVLALSQLVSFCGSESETLPLVSGKEDHVSKLMRMSSSPSVLESTGAVIPAMPPRADDDDSMEDVVGHFANTAGPDLAQTRRLGPPTFEMSDPIDVPFRGAFQLRWQCACVLPWCGRRFPGDVEQGKPHALFANKKDAKQYAAMLAVAYLKSVTKEIAMSHTPRETPPPVEVPRPREEQEQPSPPSEPRQPAEQQRPPRTQSAPAQPTAAQPAPDRPAPKQMASHLPPFEPLPLAPSPPPSQPSPALHHPVLPSSTPPPDTAGTPNPSVLATAPAVPSTARFKRPLESPTTPDPVRASPLRTRNNQQQQHKNCRPRSPAPAPVAAVPFVSPKGRGADAAAEQARLFGAIARLCLQLGLSQPQYRLTQDVDRPSFFSGRAEFSAASRVPEDIAVVRDVLGKRQARIQIAEQVLAWMEKEEARRRKLFDGMMS